MTSTKELVKAFMKHKRRAKARRIEFLLTFREWHKIWLDSGKLELRGPRGYNYCMARFGDVGPYAVGNVKIITKSENSKEANPIGRIVPAKTRQKMSASKMGKKVGPFSDKHRKNLSLSRKGMKLSEEHKNNIGKSVTGARNGFYGKTHSLATRKRLKEASLAWWARKRGLQ